MLLSLKIENIAIIEQAGIDFSAGFNCLTGETGAGKSIIIDSINCIAGEKTSRELIRTGAKSARVTALFSDVDKDCQGLLSEYNIPVENDEVVISRTIFPDGKNNCRVNGEAVTVSMLKNIGSSLINIHGQHDSQALLQPEKHIVFIDALADDEEELACYYSAYVNIKKLSDEIDKLSAEESERLKKIDLLKYQINEITSAKLNLGEYDSLLQKKKIANNARRLYGDLSYILSMLEGTENTDGVKQLLEQSGKILQSDNEIIGEERNFTDRIENITDAVDSITGELNDILRGISIGDNDIDAIENRMALLEKLFKKYGADEKAVLEYLEKADEELIALEHSDERLEQLNNEFTAALEDVKHKARVLSEKRRNAASEFSRRIKEELEFLDMPSVTFVVDRKATALTPTGIDNMEFLISANAGEPPKPLSKIASGGELSRIMLAIKTVLAGKDKIGTLIFDEIDTGVSGRAAEKIAIKMKEISRHRQVLCVTHLSQIAAYADNHFLIEKTVRDDRTFTEITRLGREGRIKEIARISGGENIGEALLRSAEEILDAASSRGDNL